MGHWFVTWPRQPFFSNGTWIGAIWDLFQFFIDVELPGVSSDSCALSLPQDTWPLQALVGCIMPVCIRLCCTELRLDLNWIKRSDRAMMRVVCRIRYQKPNSTMTLRTSLKLAEMGMLAVSDSMVITGAWWKLRLHGQTRSHGIERQVMQGLYDMKQVRRKGPQNLKSTIFDERFNMAVCKITYNRYQTSS